MPTSMLIVDDSRLSVQIISKIVTSQFPDWQITTAANADEALALPQELVFDLATLDFNMPGMNGVELGLILKSRFPQAKMALLTANIQDTIVQKAQAAGLTFIPKPVSAEKVLNFLGPAT